MSRGVILGSQLDLRQISTNGLDFYQRAGFITIVIGHEVESKASPLMLSKEVLAARELRSKNETGLIACSKMRTG